MYLIHKQSLGHCCLCLVRILSKADQLFGVLRGLQHHRDDISDSSVRVRTKCWTTVPLVPLASLRGADVSVH